MIVSRCLLEMSIKIWAASNEICCPISKFQWKAFIFSTIYCLELANFSFKWLSYMYLYGAQPHARATYMVLFKVYDRVRIENNSQVLCIEFIGI